MSEESRRQENIELNGGACPDSSDHEPGERCDVCGQTFHEYEEGCVCNTCHRHWWETTEWQRESGAQPGQMALFDGLTTT